MLNQSYMRLIFASSHLCSISMQDCQSRRKRQYSQIQTESDTQHSRTQSGSEEHSLPKRRKLSESRYHNRRPAAFWDNLSIIHLTRSAIEEQNRRFDIASREPPVHTPSIPEPRTNDVRRFARQGGPDLSDLRGVRGTNIDLSKLICQYSTVMPRQNSNVAEYRKASHRPEPRKTSDRTQHALGIRAYTIDASVSILPTTAYILFYIQRRKAQSSRNLKTWRKSEK